MLQSCTTVIHCRGALAISHFISVTFTWKTIYIIAECNPITHHNWTVFCSLQLYSISQYSAVGTVSYNVQCILIIMIWCPVSRVYLSRWEWHNCHIPAVVQESTFSLSPKNSNICSLGHICQSLICFVSAGACWDKFSVLLSQLGR